MRSLIDLTSERRFGVSLRAFGPRGSAASGSFIGGHAVALMSCWLGRARPSTKKRLVFAAEIASGAQPGCR
jgi:hypothetical protein